MAVSVVRSKYALRKKALNWNAKHPKDVIQIPKVRWAVPKWGQQAQVLAWRYTSKVWPKEPSAQLDARLVEHLFPNRVPALKLIKARLSWARPLVPRNGKPSHIVWHNAAAKACTIFAVHSWHLNNGWSGCAYHFFVRKNGKIYVGRPEGMCGGHTKDFPATIGICFEGNFDAERMGDKQLRAGQALHRYLHRKYAGVPDKGHRDMPGNVTSCPGKYFPLDKITSYK